jgi:hypothetical protein
MAMAGHVFAITYSAVSSYGEFAFCIFFEEKEFALPVLSVFTIFSFHFPKKRRARHNLQQ